MHNLYKFLWEEEIIMIHDEVLAESGGLPGLCPDKSLESALYRIENKFSYEGPIELHEIAALYAIVIAQGHVFNDGNKRTALTTMVNFLALNGIALIAPDLEIENIMVDIAEKKISRNDLVEWIKKYSYPNEEP